MRKYGSVGFAVVGLAMLVGISGCGSGSGVTTVNYPVPASIGLSPTPTGSMEIGTTLSFTASPANSAGASITEPVNYQSSNPAVVTVAANGLACAGSWDSLTSPQICTAGRVGVAEVSATTQGVTSPISTVYVHAHIDGITLQPAANQHILPCLSANPSLNQALIYEGHAFSRGIDITPTAGQFSFTAENANVAKLSNTAPGLANMLNGVSLNQVQITADMPGITPLYATVGNTISSPVSYTTCPVQSIRLAVTSSTGSTQQITPTVLDTLGNQLLNPPLTYSSSNPDSVSVNSTGSVSETAGIGGAATIVASCTPPTCNIGFTPSLPIYPQNVVTQTVNSGSTTPSGTLYVTSTGCAGIDDCFTAVVPIAYPANTLASSAAFAGAPNSLVFNRQGTQAYLGTKSGILSGGRGLIVLGASASPPTLSQIPSAPGKVLAASPDGTRVIISDTVNSPNQVYVVNTSNSLDAVTSYPITGATAASFSPDSLKAFLVAGSKLYIYSKSDALKAITLGAPATDIAFLTEGAFGYLAGGSVTGSTTNVATVYRTCDNGKTDTVSGAAVPAFIRALPDATKMVALAPPNVEMIGVTASPVGCTPALSDVLLSPYNLGQGDFSPSLKQFILSEDGTAAYVVSSSLSSILVFGTSSLTSSSIALQGNVYPVQAALTPDGGLLYVAASDGNVHVLDTHLGADVQQIVFPQNFCLNSAGQPQPFACKPDLIAVRP